jgi:hypothetical protein
LGATPDHGGCCLVSGDVLVGLTPVLVTPGTGIGGVDGKQFDTVLAGLGGKPVAEHRGRDAGHSFAEAFPARSLADGFAAHGAGVGEVEVLHRNSADAMLLGVVDQARDRVPHLGVAAGRGAGQADVDAVRLTDRVAVGVKVSHREVTVVEVHSYDRVRARTSA